MLHRRFKAMRYKVKSAHDIHELGALPLRRPVLLAYAIALVADGSDIAVWCRRNGVDTEAAVGAALGAGVIRSARARVPAKGVRTFVDGDTFEQEVAAFLAELPAGWRPPPAPTPALLKRLRARVRNEISRRLGQPDFLRVVERLCRRPEHFVQLVRRSPFAPMQSPLEILWLVKILAARKPRLVLEVGTAVGGTLYLFSRMARADARLVSIDIEARYDRALLQSFARHTQEIHLLQGDSTAPVTVARVRSLLPQGVDLLFLDGDHAYDGISRDFATYSGLVRPGGIIVFHDIADDNATRCGFTTGGQSGGVPRFWREIKQRHPHQECIADPQQDGFGIGVLFP